MADRINDEGDRNYNNNTSNVAAVAVKPQVVDYCKSNNTSSNCHKSEEVVLRRPRQQQLKEKQKCGSGSESSVTAAAVASRSLSKQQQRRTAEQINCDGSSSNSERRTPLTTTGKNNSTPSRKKKSAGWNELVTRDVPTATDRRSSTSRQLVVRDDDNNNYTNDVTSTASDNNNEGNYEELQLHSVGTHNSRPVPLSRQQNSPFEDHIYENLTYIENCYRRLPVHFPLDWKSGEAFGEEDNIYENICDKCDQIFSGELCKNCVKHNENALSVSGGGERKKRSFSDFFNSLKRGQKTAEKKAVQKSQRIEIVHNVDGFAGVPFKANQTFDLKEICALKLIHEQEQEAKKKKQQLLNTVESDELKLSSPQVDNNDEEVVWRRKKRKTPRKRRSSGEPEIVSPNNNRAIHQQRLQVNDGEAEEEDEEEDAFVAPDLNLNSLRSAYEALVESLAKDTAVSLPGGDTHVTECDDSLEVSSTNRTVIDPYSVVQVAPLTNDNSRKSNELDRVTSTPVVVNFHDETTTIHSSLVITRQSLEPERDEKEPEENDQNKSPVVELISPLENNSLCLSVRQWMTSLQYETNDDDVVEHSPVVIDPQLGTRRNNHHNEENIDGEINRPNIVDWYFVKPIPSRTFEEHHSYYNHCSSSQSPSSSSSSFHHRRRLNNNSLRRTSSSSACESELNLRINCFKSEVNRNLEQQRVIVARQLAEEQKKASQVIVITVKDEKCYHEKAVEDCRNNYCESAAALDLTASADKSVDRVTHLRRQNSVEKSSREWKVPDNDDGEKCNNNPVVVVEKALQLINNNNIESDNDRASIYLDVNVLVEALSTKNTTKLYRGGCQRQWSDDQKALQRRRNAITESRRNSLKFQLFTRQLLSRTVVQGNGVFSLAAHLRRVPDQLALLHRVLKHNKSLLRSHRVAFLSVRGSNVVEFVMGVLSLVDSASQAEIALRGAIVDRPMNGQNDLDGSGSGSQESESSTGTVKVDAFNIEEEQIRRRKVSVKEQRPEAIYQPIWKFHTMGIGRESTSSDTYDGSYNTSDFAEVGDTVEWEIAEEFEFGSSRETLLDNSSLDGEEKGSTRSIMSSSTSSGQTQSTVTMGGEDVSSKVGNLENIYSDVVPKWRFSYKPVCILYDLSDAANNSIIHNYDGNRSSAQTRRQLQRLTQRQSQSSSGSESGSSDGGDRVAPLLSSSGGENVCESEMLLAAERGGRRQQDPPPLRRRVGGYECGDGVADSPTHKQCRNRNSGNNKSRNNCYDGTAAAATTTKSYEGANEKVMPPKVYLIPDSVAAWKFMLLDTNYAEDEEDVIMSVPNLLDYDTPVMLERKKLPPLQVPSKDSKLQKTNLLNPKKYVNSGRLNIEDQKGTNYLHKSIVGSYKQIEFGSVDNLNSLSKSKSTSSILSASSSPTKRSPRFQLRFRPNSPRDDAAAKQDRQRTVVFGSDLNTLKLDVDTGVPKFVVECIRLIEEPENIQTNGIYRASGNKNSIELVKKRMNERLNIRRDTMWQFLEKQDVHTLTGSLKLFFRGLTTQLIPDSLFDQLPEILGDESSLESIRIVVVSLDELPRVTLKFLIRHLTVVTEHKAENLMNSSNLSICWGACLFASSATAFDSFESGNIIRKNHFVRVLIDHYDEIFEGGSSSE